MRPSFPARALRTIETLAIAAALLAAVHVQPGEVEMPTLDWPPADPIDKDAGDRL